MAQAYSTPPRPEKGAASGPGKRARVGHRMGGLFGSVTPKKPEFDRPAPSRASARAKKRERMKRLDKVFI